MADDFDDVEDMLEAPFRKDAGMEIEQLIKISYAYAIAMAYGNLLQHMFTGNGEQVSPSGERKKRRSKHRSHRRSKHSRSRSTSRSPRRRHRRSASRERHKRSRSKEHRGSRDRNHRSRSREKQRVSMSPPGRRHSYRGGGRGGGGGGGMAMDHMFRRMGGRSPEPDPPSQERDSRTVMCMQLAAYVGPKELEEFFQKVGQVKEVKMIADKNSRRSKGIAYVEFHDESSVPPALQQTGQKLFGVPIIVQPTMAEKNRLAALAQNLMKKEGPRNLYVGSLHYNISEDMLKKIFEPFGHVEKLTIQRDDNGLSKGYGFIEFRDSEAAERAKQNLDGFELAGRPIKVNHVTDRGDHIGGAMEMLDSDNFTTGVGMTQQGRASLMAKLAVGHNAGLVVPTIPALATPLGTGQPIVPLVVASSCLMLTNMFDLLADNEPGWEEDIRDDVLEELMAFGNTLHIYVDPISQGNVYVKTANSQVASSAINSLDGRYFAGKKVTAQRIPELTYHMKFPEAIGAVVPLKPS